MSTIFINSFLEAGIATLVQDLFNDTNGVDLPTHLPDIDVVGGGWLNYGAGLEIVNNSAGSITDVAAGYAGIQTNKADVIITATLNLAVGAGEFVGVIARLTDANNYWFIGTNNASGTDTFRIQEVVAGTPTTAVTQNNVTAVGNVYELVVTVSGTTITATLNGVELSYGSATHNQAATIHGVFNQRATRLLVEDILIVG